MKRLIAAVLIFIFALSIFTACQKADPIGKTPNGDSQSEDSEDQGETEDKEDANNHENKPTVRVFPETTSKTLVLADQFPTTLSPEQVKFAAEHFVGTEKTPVSFNRMIRKVNPNFIVLHYHLAIWQSAVPYIIDGENWGNDLDVVDPHEDWFMHTGGVQSKDKRMQAFDDHKYLMNITNEEYYQYFLNKMIEQCKAGEYDGIFLDSYSTNILNYYLQNYPDFQGTKAKDDKTHPELGGKSWLEASEIFMKRLTEDLEKHNIKALPNISDFVTAWDTTDYSLSHGGMAEGALQWQKHYDWSEWKRGMNGLIPLVNKDKILILESFLDDELDYRERLYRLGSYLLIRGKYTYITYFKDNPFRYYPEFDVDVGTPLESAQNSIDDLKVGDLYIREFDKGIVVVNPNDENFVTYSVPEGYKKVTVEGGGTISNDGTINGRVIYETISGNTSLPPKSALILVKA
jgi:hypothetical protein